MKLKALTLFVFLFGAFSGTPAVEIATEAEIDCAQQLASIRSQSTTDIDSIRFQTSIFTEKASEGTRVISYKDRGVQFLERVQGVPSSTRAISNQGVWRYYIPNKEIANFIQSQKILQAGINSYVQSYAGTHRSFIDLTGLFFTLPETSPNDVGLESSQHLYVDFKFIDDFQVLQIEPNILLIPGTPSLPQWIVKLYQSYLESGELPKKTTERSVVLKLIDTGGFENPLRVRINIVGSNIEP